MINHQNLSIHLLKIIAQHNAIKKSQLYTLIILDKSY
jgi:hypothetical protein